MWGVWVEKVFRVEGVVKYLDGWGGDIEVGVVGFGGYVVGKVVVLVKVGGGYEGVGVEWEVVDFGDGDIVGGRGVDGKKEGVGGILGGVEWWGEEGGGVRVEWSGVNK